MYLNCRLPERITNIIAVRGWCTTDPRDKVIITFLLIEDAMHADNLIRTRTINKKSKSAYGANLFAICCSRQVK